MSISANFFKNNKRVNSTKLPDYGAGTFGTTIELKDYTNLFTPTLILSQGLFHDSNNNKINPLEYNYCYIPEFKRYYFIRTWNWALGRWECDLEVDLMTSFRTEIGNTTAYVLRSASQWDSRIIDTKYPTKGEVKSLSEHKSSMWYTNLSSTSVTDGFFVLGIVNNDSGAIGATSYYAVNARGMRRFMAELYASPSWMNITDNTISTDLQKMLINPIQYIVSCMWIPCTLTGYSSLSQVTTVPVGWWNITINSNDPFYKLTGSSLKLSLTNLIDFDTIYHPQAVANTKLSWLKNSPYSQYQLQFYPFGVFPIDSAKLVGYNTLQFKIDIDLITGQGTLTVVRAKPNDTHWYDILFSTNAQVGIPITMAQMSVDWGKLNNGTNWALSAGMALTQDSSLQEAVSQTYDAVVDAVDKTPAKSFWNYLTNAEFRRNYSPEVRQESENAITNAKTSLLSTVGKVASSIGNAVLASSGSCVTTGTTGALAQYTLDIVLTLFYYEIVDIDPDRYGYPLCQLKKINTLSGFTLCANEGDLAVPATSVERQAIAGIMKEGFFYE